MKQILIVDDSRVIRKVARAILEKLHFETCEAENGEDAIALCRRQLPDGILLDSNMPVMNGYDFVRELRRMPAGREPKVVFCASEHDAGQIARALHAGADTHVLKPFEKSTIRETLMQVGLMD
eukprot:gene26018-28396_t